MIFRRLTATVRPAVKDRKAKPPRSVIFRQIIEEKRRRRTTSTGSLDGSMITKDNHLVRAEVSDSVDNSLRVIPEHNAENSIYQSEVDRFPAIYHLCSVPFSIVV